MRLDEFDEDPNSAWQECDPGCGQMFRPEDEENGQCPYCGGEFPIADDEED